MTGLSNAGSCVAFANMAAIETCFKKKTGVFGEFSETFAGYKNHETTEPGDYSEQQLVDCGYQKNGASFLFLFDFSYVSLIYFCCYY